MRTAAFFTFTKDEWYAWSSAWHRLGAVQVLVFPPLISTTYVGAVWSGVGKGLEPQGIGSGGFCPTHLSPSLTDSFCFLSKVALDLLGNPRPVSIGPAWMMLAAGQSVLVVARGLQWAQTRGCLTTPTRSLKDHPPSNVWFPFPGGWVTPQPCAHLSLVPKEDGDRLAALCPQYPPWPSEGSPVSPVPTLPHRRQPCAL